MKFALHFVVLLLTIVPALIVFRYGVMKRKSSNFFCFGMNPVLLPILHPLLVIAVSKLFLYIAFVSTFDAAKYDKADRAARAVEGAITGLADPSGTLVRMGGKQIEGKIAWTNGSVTVTDDDDKSTVVPVAEVARMRVEGSFSFVYHVFRLLFTLAVPASVLILMKDLYNPKSVGTAFGCAIVSFLLWTFAISL